MFAKPFHFSRKVDSEIGEKKRSVEAGYCDTYFPARPAVDMPGEASADDSRDHAFAKEVIAQDLVKRLRHVVTHATRKEVEEFITMSDEFPLFLDA